MSAYTRVNQIGDFHSPRRILIGVGILDNIGKEINKMGLKKTFIVTDKTMTKLGYTEKVKNAIEKKEIKCNVFDEISTEPTVEIMANVAKQVRSDFYDSIVGLGGGSCMDTAKAAAILATNEGNIIDYAGANKIKNAPLKKILVPTTAGTGSEVTMNLIWTDGMARRGMFDPKMIAELAMVDPLTTITLPPNVTAFTGMDALSHAIEAMMSTTSNPLAEAIALEAVYLIFKNIRKAYAHGNDLEARYNMAYAATLGGLPLNYVQHAAAWAHSFCYTVGPRYNIPHGYGCAIGLPYAMELNLYPKAQILARIAQAAGEDIRGLSEIEAALSAVRAVKKLLEDLHIPIALKDLNIPEKILPLLARELLTTYPRRTSPRQINEKEALEFYERMWRGEIRTKL